MLIRGERCFSPRLASLREMFRGSLNEFAGIEDMLRIQHLFQFLMQLPDPRRRRLFPPRFFRQADPMLAGDHALPFQDLRKKLVQRAVGFLPHAGNVHVHHQVDVNVAVAGVAEGGDLDVVTALESFGEPEQIDEAAARDGDVLVELGEARGLQ